MYTSVDLAVKPLCGGGPLPHKQGGLLHQIGLAMTLKLVIIIITMTMRVQGIYYVEIPSTKARVLLPSRCPYGFRK